MRGGGEGCSWGRQWVKLDACAASHACEGRETLSTVGVAFNFPQTIDCFLFFFRFFSFSISFWFCFSFVLFCCYCKQNQHKLKTIINMSGLSDLRGSGKVGGRSEGGNVGCVSE